ncbi:replication initiator protein [Peromfec virus RodF8_22]|uniref:Replication initiator protein n=1 Tax=Peromfec virus RodF8_22 TaxID=2929364 RepID=A0A976N1X0_9VIRU|nr:replication initiator protein [Peromfec virus RodF8_22]
MTPSQQDILLYGLEKIKHETLTLFGSCEADSGLVGSIIKDNAITEKTLKCPYRAQIYNPTLKENIIVPCGRCFNCQVKKALALSTRIRLDSTSYPNLFFVTLTYSNHNIEPIDPSYLARFFKNLRYDVPKFKYLASGEYGPQTIRPHYHILFLLPYETSFADFKEALSTRWPYGNIDIQPSDALTTSYICSYVKKGFNTTDCFTVRSLRPALGHSAPKDYLQLLLDQCISNQSYFISSNAGHPMILNADLFVKTLKIDKDLLSEYIPPVYETDLASDEEKRLYINSLYSALNTASKTEFNEIEQILHA